MRARSLADFTSRAMSRSAARFGVKQVALLGFVQLTAGARRVNTFSRSAGWCVLDADEAARRMQFARQPMPQRASSEPVKPVKLPTPVTVERPRTMQRATPSLPRLRCLEADSR